MADESKVRNFYKGPITLDGLSDGEVAKKNMQTSSVDLTPFKAAVSDSWAKKQAGEKNCGKHLTVPDAATNKYITLFRNAATELGLGVGVEKVTSGTPRGQQFNVPEGQTRIIVVARKRKEKVSKTDTPAGAPAGAPAAPTTPAAAKPAGAKFAGKK